MSGSAYPGPASLVTSDERLKRMVMRSWRRGTKEMDLILGPYANARIEGLDPATLDLFDALLLENDQDLYFWVTGAKVPPERYVNLLAEIGEYSLDKPRRF
jgi:antitoxin CptB